MQVTHVKANGVGSLVKHWRSQRARSQLDLAYSVGVSPRHLSFVETGRSKPSAELVIALATHLDVPLRERNTMLLAAGFAPRYEHTSLDEPSMTAIIGSLHRLLSAHDPYPGLIVDRHWNVVLANRAAGLFASVLPSELVEPLNIFRASLHPDGLAAYTVNFPEWATHMLGQLARIVAGTGDAQLRALEQEIHDYPNIRALGKQRLRTAESARTVLVVPCVLSMHGRELSLYTTLTTFGTPHDITLDELVIELFFPADDATDQALHALAPVAKSVTA
jgi:transcriptional regulator with XRE-family HTH domain